MDGHLPIYLSLVLIILSVLTIHLVNNRLLRHVLHCFWFRRHRDSTLRASAPSSQIANRRESAFCVHPASTDAAENGA
jgi:hypothetical protein